MRIVLKSIPAWEAKSSDSPGDWIYSGEQLTPSYADEKDYNIQYYSM